MTAALLFLMGYQFWGDAAHEWAGAVMFVLFILHHILNRGWYRALPKGRYSPARVFQLVINLLLLLVMMGQMVSGIILSRCVFSFLPISGGMSFARLLHMAAAYWGFVLMALHLGLHWNMVSGRLGKVLGHSRSSRWRTIAGRTAGIVLAVYGLFAFISRDLPDYMFLRTQFVFMDFSEPVVLFYLDYLAMMGFFIFAAHYLSRGMKHYEEKYWEFTGTVSDSPRRSGNHGRRKAELGAGRTYRNHRT